MGNNMVYLGYGQGVANNVTGKNEDSESTALTLAGVHTLSKHTLIYAAYSKHEQDNDAAVNTALGLITGNPVMDPEEDIIAIGAKHRF